ncbi:uncharacterized protein LOC113294925 [Papaver somniferum]|uniref:uncharacterized protein LOC113294925 n=1 Tax=Papaver somniferum TaxID=3469 RepID=UPI000E6F886F|nr:uncharacterized protein LOC113294925 [Papaver somniferum]
MDWYPGFDPERQKTSHANVWVHFPGLHAELWMEKNLLSMGKVLGNPIVVDQRTLTLEFENFTSVLVDIYFAKHIPDRIRLTAGGRTFWQNLDIPKPPKFCLKCCIIGHTDKECRKQSQQEEQSTKVDASANGESSQGWQEAKNKRQRRRRNSRVPANSNDAGDAEKPVTVEENAEGVEETTHLEEELASSEDQLQAASLDVEKAKKALTSKAALAKKLVVGETTTSQAKSVKSGELERTNRSNSDKNNAGSSSTPVATFGENLMRLLI